MVFPPIWGEKMAAFWACACKLSWTLLSPARVQPLYGAGRKESSGTGLGVAKRVTDVLTTFWRLLWSITESDARQHGIYLFYRITKSHFYFKKFQHNAKAGLLPRLCPAFDEKTAIWRDLWSIQNEAISLVAMRSKESAIGKRWRRARNSG